MTFVERLAVIVGVELPMKLDSGIRWPYWPLTRASRHSSPPGWPFVFAARAAHMNANYYAWLPLAVVMRLCGWWDGRRFCIENWCIDRGMLVGPEAGYYHEFHWAPPRRWFHGRGDTA